MSGCVQVAGQRRVLLMSPEHAHKGMYPFPLHHPYDGYAMPDLDRPDAEAWPLLWQVRGQATILQPGEALFVPSYWCVPSAAPCPPPHPNLCMPPHQARATQDSGSGFCALHRKVLLSSGVRLCRDMTCFLSTQNCILLLQVLHRQSS